MAVLVFAAPAVADGESVSLVQMQAGLDTLWVILAGVLVFFMQAGFGMIEAGFIRTKNACNILTRNFLDYCTASITFFLVGPVRGCFAVGVAGDRRGGRGAGRQAAGPGLPRGGASRAGHRRARHGVVHGPGLHHRTGA